MTRCSTQHQRLGSKTTFLDVVLLSVIFGKHVGGMQRNCTETLESAFATHAQDAAAISLTHARIASIAEHFTLHTAPAPTTAVHPFATDSATHSGQSARSTNSGHHDSRQRMLHQQCLVCIGQG